MNILGAFTALWNSEKAVAGGALVVGATVLTALGHMTVQEWTEYTKWIFGIYVAGKTTQSAVSAVANKAKPAVSTTDAPQD